MPRLSDSMEEGTILTWLKQVGDEVAVGDELVEIETDKANMAYEADVAGTLQEILAQEGETLPIGAPIARIGDSNGQPETDQGQGAQAAGPVSDTTPAPTGAGPASSPPTADEQEAAGSDASAADDGERVKASPLARRLARDKGLDLKALHGSGPGGRIVKHDVEEAEVPSSAAPTPSAQPDGAGSAPPQEAGHTTGGTAKGTVETRELNKLQQTIARRMAESKATAPHFYLTIEVDMGKAVEARAGFKAAARERPPV